jgi:hypothetical protein
VPWEKLSLVTFRPASIMARKTSGDEEAGPMVATILVFLYFMDSSGFGAGFQPWIFPGRKPFRILAQMMKKMI